MGEGGGWREDAPEICKEDGVFKKSTKNIAVFSTPSTHIGAAFPNFPTNKHRIPRKMVV